MICGWTHQLKRLNYCFTIFIPLTFLSVYGGMNFKIMPESTGGMDVYARIHDDIGRRAAVLVSAEDRILLPKSWKTITLRKTNSSEGTEINKRTLSHWNRPKATPGGLSQGSVKCLLTDIPKQHRSVTLHGSFGSDRKAGNKTDEIPFTHWTHCA